MKAVEKKENDWNILAYGLRRSKDPEITAFFIRLVQQNLYVKDANGNRMKFGFGSSHGCEEITNELGSGLAIHLGEIGGKRAVTALKEAVEQGDSAVRDGAYRALYKLGEYSFEEILSMLGAISFDEKFGMNVTNSVGLSPNTVMAIIEDVEALDYKCANKLFDRIIEKFPAGSDQVARAHFSKILSYRQHEQFDLALRQCEVALQKGKLRDYAVRISEIRSDIIKGAQQSSANHPAKAPESKSEGK